MSLEIVRTTTRDIVNLISDGHYGQVLQMCSISRLSEKDIETALRNYGRTFVRPAAEFDKCLDLVQVAGRSPTVWSIRAPLWTIEEGRSDLTLELTVTDATSGPVIELDDLRVM